ncbi:MAG: hypothetical protein P9F19_03210 [Candidatus Contendobacter sp.]|nr:hypothetical protein [Candidatus Contendobacter sp.]MDG4556394.1 hypothetical protein [Candidatus Contendobacter sp.]
MGKVTCSFFHACVLLGGLSWLAPPSAAAAKPDAEEFVAPLGTMTAPSLLRRGSGPARAVKDATTGETAFHAKTAQDAIAAAIGHHVAGCWPIRFGDAGFGWVATGAADPATTSSPDTVQHIQAGARFKAFVDARTRLKECLRALSPEARRRMTGKLEQNDAIRLALTNLAANDQERYEQALDILGRGFVAYAVEDDPASHVIRVHLVATPKTAARLTRPTASAMEAASLREGLRQTQTEVANGLVPSVGNRLIVVNATGELALVGYAIHPFGAPLESGTLDLAHHAAEQIAISHATKAFLGLAVGDDAGWQGGLDEADRAQIRAAASGYDDTEPSARRFGQIRDLVLSAVKEDSGLHALREGRLPPAATIKRFGGQDTIAVMVIYAPSIRKHGIAPPAPPTTPATEPAMPAAPATPALPAAPAPMESG